jgi:hypothetical protein
VGALQDNVSLLAAGLDLALVQSVLSAIRTADLSQPQPSQYQPATSVTLSQRPASSLPGQPNAPRNSDHPAATYNAQPVENPHLRRCRDLLPYPCPRPVEMVHDDAPVHPPSVQPPWKVLPWPIAVQKTSTRHFQPVKILPNRDDVTTAGRLLDIFV